MACIFIKAQAGRKTHKRSHAETLYHAVPELSAFGKPVNTVVLALVGMETQVHTRKTLTVHKTERRPGSDGRMSFLFLFKTLRGTAGSKKSHTATKNKRPTTFIHCPLGQFEKNLTPQQLSTNLHWAPYTVFTDGPILNKVARKGSGGELLQIWGHNIKVFWGRAGGGSSFLSSGWRLRSEKYL